MVTQLQADPHPPAMVRVLLTLQNNEDFQQAFQCQAGDRMISGNPCRVWWSNFAKNPYKDPPTK